jgi:hypothetical protein
MDNSSTTASDTRRIDLTKQVDQQFWCRLFDVSLDELRMAVKQAGHRMEDVQRYLRQKRGEA